MLSRECFRFLNQEHCLPRHGGWNDASLEKLWLYNLHYFDDLNAENAASRNTWHVEFLQRWVRENVGGKGNGWEPYPTSLRIVNWIKWIWAGNAMPPACIDSLAVQAHWLAHRLEWHLLGNHLFANAKALVFAGLLFQGDEADDWLKTGLDIIGAELDEQILSDGGNFERSTMYHSIFLEDLLDLINAAQAHPGVINEIAIKKWKIRATSMLEWMAGMAHPDGQISLFNDAAMGIAPEPRALQEYAARVDVQLPTPQALNRAGLQIRHWPDSGYIRLQTDNVSAFLDVGPVGPDYLPGHAHADTLSFELSVFGCRVIVNGGTSCYGSGSERLRERQTMSHSTVEVAGESSSEVWGSFRVARRARPIDLQVHEESETLSVSCSHDGYTRLSGKPVHRRNWIMDRSGLSITDVVSAGVEHTAVARFILHPAISIVWLSNQSWQLVLPCGSVVTVDVVWGAARICSARFAPEFGKILQTFLIEVELLDGRSEVKLRWA